MATPLLMTKLHRPVGPRGSVDRSRLLDRLDRSSGPLVLVSAPAGFGKTTLVAEWLASDALGAAAVAWVSLDSGDDEPRTFWTYVTTALGQVVPGVLDAVAPVLEADELRVDELVTAVLNEVHALGDRQVVLVLDDLHTIADPAILDGLSLLVDHAPTNLRLVVTSRADPNLPLPRLRVRGQLLEVRAADLRFREEEAAAYLVDAMGLPLTDADVAALERRTEGWIAALQLAALSLRDRADPSSFIDAFAGDDRYVIDYLAGEVLDRQPEQVRDFLLATSILDQLDADVCASLTGDDGAGAILQQLERDNLFVVPLDDRRRVYRYHHLFADALRAQLARERPDVVPALHLAASDHYDAHGRTELAVHHALASHDVDRAAHLVERAIPQMRQQRKEATLHLWFQQLPRSVVRERPVLGLGLVGALMTTGRFDDVDELLRAVEELLRTSEPTELAVSDREEFARVPMQLAMYRAALALIAGDLDDATVHAEVAFERAGDSDHLGRGSSAALLGLAAWGRGDVDLAARRYATALPELVAAGHLSDVLGCSIAQADIELARGRPDAAVDCYERGRRLIATAGSLRGAADMEVGLADLCRERNDLVAATTHLQSADDLGPGSGLPQNAYRRALVLAQVRAAEGALDEAFRLFGVAEECFDGDFSPEVRPIHVIRARWWVTEGRFDQFARWADERGRSLDEPASYVHELELATLAAGAVASAALDGGGRGHSSSEGAAALLDRLLTLAEAQGRVGSMILLLAERALVHRAHGEDEAARSAVARSLGFAASAGWARIYLDRGEQMIGLVGTLVDDAQAGAAARRALRGVRAEPSPPVGTLLDPLSERELDVLRLLRSELSGPEIAAELVVSLNTVRTHTKNIYLKLGVNSRRAAVRRADELGL